MKSVSFLSNSFIIPLKWVLIAVSKAVPVDFFNGSP